jgi:hypothetical protein
MLATGCQGTTGEPRELNWRSAGPAPCPYPWVDPSPRSRQPGPCHPRCAACFKTLGLLATTPDVIQARFVGHRAHVAPHDSPIMPAVLLDTDLIRVDACTGRSDGHKRRQSQRSGLLLGLLPSVWRSGVDRGWKPATPFACASRFLRSPSGIARRSWPSSSSRSNAYSMAWPR